MAHDGQGHEAWDAVVVGGGAAGFWGAIACAQAWPQARVLILERSRRVLQKVKISGGGRCNVTHHSDDPRWMSTQYPRGQKELLGPLHRFGPRDVVRWFEARGVQLKAEADGRMFPVTDSSQTIIDCLRQAAQEAGVSLRTRAGVDALINRSTPDAPRFGLICEGGARVLARRVLLATGGTRAGAGAALAKSLGHTVLPAVPSLFTFHVNEDPRLEDLQGVSVEHVAVRALSTNLEARGALVVTHWGLSGPAVLRLSAWGARALHRLDYRFTLEVDWLPGVDVAGELEALSRTWGKRQIATRSPFDALPKRLWQRLVEAAAVPSDLTWAQCPKRLRRALVAQVHKATFEVCGKSLNKDEFVTCGGVAREEVDLRTMESRRCPGVHFAGELLDVDGVTGGFNFQHAWTTGQLAGVAMAEAMASDASYWATGAR